MADEMFKAVEELRAKMITEHCKNKDDDLKLASYFAWQAILIYNELGGPKLVADRFSQIAEDIRKNPPDSK